MAADARSDMSGRGRGFGPEGPLVRTRRAATIGFGVLAAVAVAILFATNSSGAIPLFAPALLPAAVDAVVIIVATTVRERRVLRGEVLAAGSSWAKQRGMALAIAGAGLIVVGAIALEAGVFLAFSSFPFWVEPQTSARAADWGFAISVAGAIGLLLGTVLYPFTAIKAATARASRLQTA